MLRLWLCLAAGFIIGWIARVKLAEAHDNLDMTTIAKQLRDDLKQSTDYCNYPGCTSNEPIAHGPSGLSCYRHSFTDWFKTGVVSKRDKSHEHVESHGNGSQTTVDGETARTGHS